MEPWTIKFVLEIETPIQGRFSQQMVIPMVASYQRSRKASTMREWTLGDRPVKQKMGYREDNISISGVAGNAVREGFKATGETIKATGEALFAEFDKFILAYEEEGKVTEGPITRSEGTRPRLIFRSLEYGTADYVEIERYSVQRNAGDARMMTSYSLDLVTEGPVKRPSRIAFGAIEQQNAAANKLGNKLSVLEPPTESFQTIDSTADGINKAANRDPSSLPPLVDGATQGVYTASVPDIIDAFPIRWGQMRDPVVKFRNALRSIQSVAGAVRTQLTFPRVVIADLYDTCSEVLETLQAAHDAIPGAANREDAREWFYEAHAAIETVRVETLTNLGATGQRLPTRTSRKAGASLTPALVEARNGVLVTRAALQGEDTLPEFAARELGDPELWRQIMELNDMASSFEAASGVPLYGGLLLFVPWVRGLPQASVSGDLFKTDLRFKDGDLVLNGTTDFALISGQPNYRQAIERRLSAIQGDNAVFLLWGMPKLIGEPGLLGTAGYIAYHVREQGEADDRTASLDGLAVLGNGDQYDASFILIPVAGEAFEVIAPLSA